MKPRLRELDFIRAFAALSVIGIHVLSTRFYVSRFAYAADTSLVFAVYVFIMISGFLLYYTNKDSEKYNIAGFYRKRAAKVIVPYIVWTVLYMIYTTNGNFNGLTIMKFAKNLAHNLLNGSAFVHLYFMVIIIQLYLIYPLLRFAMKRNPKLILVISFCITFYFLIEPYISQHGYKMLPSKFTAYYFILFPRWLFYFVFGMYLSDIIEKIIPLLSSSKTTLSMFWILMASSMVMLSRALVNGNPILNPFTIVYSVLTFFLLYAFSLSLKEKDVKILKIIKNYLEWLSKQSFVIYLSHLVVMDMAQKFFRKYIFNLSSSNFGMVLLYVIILTVTSVFAYIIALTPLAGIFGAAGTRINEKRDKNMKIPTNLNI